ncbi:LOW QUALITY PROTEIN: calsyntenin-3-like [Hemitrygon akajei]|uniref:LOW QUALITY PROTEIN: calsyntenin-3-like n=1 Tax=Hemitrygon akajei TaxID=2704970 RepID=UPI003BF95BA9
MRLHIWAAVACSLVAAALCTKANKHKPWIEAEYQGIVMENDKTVLLNPPLFAIDKDAPLRYAGEICGFKIHGQNVPFEAVVLDKMTGEGIIQAKTAVDCESQREHAFTIQAHDCGEDAQKTNVKRSHKAVVHVRVNDVNEFVPVFMEALYRVSVSEGKVPGPLLRVEAVDGDCSPQYSQICFYQILTPDVPFTIDNDGNIRNTETLDGRQETLFTFSVTAYDCGKKRAAEDAQVQVEVRPTCVPSWLGWNERIEYLPGSGSQALFPHIHLETCEQAVWDIRAVIELQTSHVAKGCDRDNYSEKTLRKLCGASRGEVDLLPPPGPLMNWTRGLPTLESQDTSQVYLFNRSRAVRVPPGAVPPGLGDSFTLSFWMKHGAASKDPHARDEEAIVCHTMPADSGFAHYALTVQGPRFSFLYWPQLGSTRPVKFRWKLEQVCDDEWHHYALSLQFPTVVLYVDGVTFEPALVMESGPFRPPRPQPRLVIGACWADEIWTETNNITDVPPAPQEPPLERSLVALLAGVTVRPGPVDGHQVLECLYSCREGLDFSDFESLGKGMKVHINPSQTQLVLEGDDIENINRAIEHVTYRNALRFATPGVRPLKLTTTMKCLSEGPCVSVAPVEGLLAVLEPEEPRIMVRGEPHLARPASDCEDEGGVQLFPGLRISCTITHHLRPQDTASPQPTAQDPLASDSFIHSLDSCEVFVLGESLDPSRDQLLLDPQFIQQKGLQVTNTSSVLTISGVESIGVYELVLRGIHYRVEPGAALYERKFRLLCGEMNGRYVSNEFTVELNVLHTLGSPIQPSHLQLGQQFLHSAHRGHPELAGHRVASTHRSSVVPGAATVIILVCVAFLVLMVILGIFRIRSVRPGPQDTRRGQEGEAFWDDSALTIIVNPMETYEHRQGSGEVSDGHDPMTPSSSGQEK